MNGFYYQVSKRYDSLSYSEKKIVDYIVDHHEDVIHMPIRSLADATGISTATILSTAVKLGFSGYTELKINLAAETSNAPQSSHVGTSAGSLSIQDSPLNAVVNTNCLLLKEISQTFDEALLIQASEMLQSAKQIYIFGEGSSDVLAHECYDLLLHADLRCRYERDWQTKQILAEQAMNEDVVILVSQTGVNSNIIDIAGRLRARDIPVIGISNYRKTAFAKNVSLLLAPFPDLLTVHDNNFSLRLPLLCIMEALYCTIASKSPGKDEALFRQNSQRTHTWSILKKNVE